MPQFALENFAKFTEKLMRTTALLAFTYSKSTMETLEKSVFIVNVNASCKSKSMPARCELLLLSIDRCKLHILALEKGISETKNRIPYYLKKSFSRS